MSPALQWSMVPAVRGASAGLVPGGLSCQIRSSRSDDIACRFIDTNYRGESLVLRHAYFTRAEEPYERLKRALKAEISEAAWATLYSTASRPFDPPATGKIAAKVTNHYGDEVLKVNEVEGHGRWRVLS
jgi:adenine-specific DNA-methyltransferase